jgi:mannose-6-phosphate isomerase-like protein (cupin superfamily)
MASHGNSDTFIEPITRRTLIRAAASAALSELIDSRANVASAEVHAPPDYQLITKDYLDEQLTKLSGKNQSVDLTFQGGRTAASTSLVNEAVYQEREFEWHETKDHIFIGLRGETVYEIGGSPTSPYRISSNEWRAAASDGAVSVTLRPGDLLTIPRGTPHRQSTGRAASFLLISPNGLTDNR